MDTPLLDWETVGEVANMAQLMKLDAVSLIVLIIKAASTAQILKRRCRHFAEHLKFIRDLLEKLKSAPLMEHPDTGGPLTRLEDVLRKSYVLVNYCQERCYLTLLMVGCSISIKLKKAQEEIDYFLKIIPLVALVDNQRFKAAHMQSPSDELIDLADYNTMLEFQARHVVEQMEPELWAKVLTPENPFRRQLIDQVISTTLPISKNPDQVSATVKAFMTADLSHELIELLEKIVLQHSAFSGNPNLQNLLILTAIRADKSRVMHYINRFDNLDDPTIGETAVRAEMYEEAFALFQKSNLNVQAVNVLLDNIGSIVRAVQFASRVQEDAVHSQVAKAQLREGLVSNAIESFIRADDATWFPDVIRVAEQASVYHDLVKYLLMVRKKVKETKVDSELVYAYAKIDKPGEIEEFILTDNVANLRSVGDRLFDEALYEAAKITFSFISNWAKLAITLVKLRQFQEAVDAAHRADSLKTWKKVCFACVDAEEFKLAQICGLKITGQVDDWNEVCDYYRHRDHYVQLISLFENCPGLERQHKRARHLRDKFMKHIKLWQSN